MHRLCVASLFCWGTHASSRNYIVTAYLPLRSVLHIPFVRSAYVYLIVGWAPRIITFFSDDVTWRKNQINIGNPTFILEPLSWRKIEMVDDLRWVNQDTVLLPLQDAARPPFFWCRPYIALLNRAGYPVLHAVSLFGVIRETAYYAANTYSP